MTTALEQVFNKFCDDFPIPKAERTGPRKVFYDTYNYVLGTTHGQESSRQKTKSSQARKQAEVETQGEVVTND